MYFLAAFSISSNLLHHFYVLFPMPCNLFPHFMWLSYFVRTSWFLFIDFVQWLSFERYVWSVHLFMFLVCQRSGRQEPAGPSWATRRPPRVSKKNTNFTNGRMHIEDWWHDISTGEKLLQGESLPQQEVELTRPLLETSIGISQLLETVHPSFSIVLLLLTVTGSWSPFHWL